MARKPLPQRTKTAVINATAKPDRKAIIAELIASQSTPALNNRSFKPEMTEYMLASVARGNTVKDVCEELGIDNGLVNARSYDDPDFGAKMRRAREIGTLAQFDHMLSVAMDFSIPVADRRLIIEVLEKTAKAFNRNQFGDKPLVSLNSPNVTFNVTPTDFDFGG